MKVNAYLERINYQGSREPNLEVLQQLQWAHLQHVPFENLDIHYHRPIIIDKARVFEKIVANKRGGFCYELNGLFGELLLQLGFDVKKISARVYDKSKGYGAEFDHLALLVTVEEQVYLTDVGFGDFTHTPLKLELNTIQQDVRGEFVINEYEYEGKYLRVCKKVKGQLIPQYLLTTIGRGWTDFKDMCHYHQTHPDSHFTQSKLITITKKEGRVTLSSKALKIIENEKVRKIELNRSTEFEEYLWDYFKIKM